MSGRIKSLYFWSGWYNVNSAFLKFQRRHLHHPIVSFSVALFQDLKQGLAITLHHSNVQVAIMYSWLNFAVGEGIENLLSFNELVLLGGLIGENLL